MTPEQAESLVADLATLAKLKDDAAARARIGRALGGESAAGSACERIAAFLASGGDPPWFLAGEEASPRELARGLVAFLGDRVLHEVEHRIRAAALRSIADGNPRAAAVAEAVLDTEAIEFTRDFYPYNYFNPFGSP